MASGEPSWGSCSAFWRPPSSSGRPFVGNTQASRSMRARENAISFRLATVFGISPRMFYEAGVRGALCDETTRAALTAIGEHHPWS